MDINGHLQLITRGFCKLSLQLMSSCLCNFDTKYFFITFVLLELTTIRQKFHVFKLDFAILQENFTNLINNKKHLCKALFSHDSSFKGNSYMPFLDW